MCTVSLFREEYGFVVREREGEREREREKERKKKDILMSCKRPKWPIRPNKRLHLKCCLVFENKKKRKEEVNNTL